VSFNALVSTDDTGISSYKWETLEGDVLSIGPIFQKTYTDPGFYAARLILTDDEGGSSSIIYPINVLQNSAPSVDFAYTTSGTSVPVTAIFDAGKSLDNRKIDFYRWSFGNMEFQTSNPIVNHVFNEAGVYQVTLTAVDDQGSSS